MKMNKFYEIELVMIYNTKSMILWYFITIINNYHSDIYKIIHNDLLDRFLLKI